MPLTEAYPTHLAVGSRTACGIKNIAHKAVKVTDDPDRVSCRKCRKVAERG